MQGSRPTVASASTTALTVAGLVVAIAFACTLPLGCQAAAARWQPLASQRLRWQYQLSGTIDTTIPADVFDIDLVDAPDAVSDFLTRPFGTGSVLT